VQITALLVLLGHGHHVPHESPGGRHGYQLVNGAAVDSVVAQEPVVENGVPKVGMPAHTA